MQAWGQAFRNSVRSRDGNRKLKGMSYQPLAGSESRMSSEGCTTNIGWKKGLRENR
jgi:hypothetical protein